MSSVHTTGATVTAHAQDAGHSIRNPTKTPTSSNLERYKYALHIRQQPRAARAGPDGKDRRPVDPPVVLQLQIFDFNPRSEVHVELLRSRFWVVFCRLFSVGPHPQDVSTVDDGPSLDGKTSHRKQLLGTNVSQPIFAPTDPDPTTAVPHPSTETSIFRGAVDHRAIMSQPGTFFVFPDLSIRTPGRYHFRFSLMMFETALRDQDIGARALAEVLSEPFTVHPAKGFDKIQESTPLVRAIAKLPDAPATLKLKKGPDSREKGKRNRGSDSDGSD